jgi:uncharacterized membrane protein YhhN
VTGAAFLWLCLVLVAAGADWAAVHVDARKVEYVLKPATMVLLIAAALALDPAEPAVRWWFVAGLVLSLAGDVFLMLPKDLFVPGLASFLLAHVAYVIGMHVAGVTAVPFLVGLAVVAVAMATLGVRIVRSVRRGPEPVLAGPVVAYMVVISAMVASAIGVGNPAMIAGAVLFYASDALIAWNRFVGETPHHRTSIMSTYHLGQIGLVLGLI